jgi:hypothetical protein
MAGLRYTIGGLRSLRYERFGFAARAIVDGHVLPASQQISRHAGAHVTQSDKSDFHRAPVILSLAFNAHPKWMPRVAGDLLDQPRSFSMGNSR